MAITATKKLNEYGGVEINGLYIRITEMRINFPYEKYVDVHVKEYLNSEKREKGEFIDSKIFSIPVEEMKDVLFNSEAMYAFCYNWIEQNSYYLNPQKN